MTDAESGAEEIISEVENSHDFSSLQVFYWFLFLFLDSWVQQKRSLLFVTMLVLEAPESDGNGKRWTWKEMENKTIEAQGDWKNYKMDTYGFNYKN